MCTVISRLALPNFYSKRTVNFTGTIKKTKEYI